MTRPAGAPRPESRTLEGRRAVVAGVGPGMGSATALRLADAGAHVLLVARSEARIHTLARTIEDRGGQAATAVADLADPTEVDALVHNTPDVLDGPPHILVNTVGGWAPGAADDPNPGLVDQMLNINLKTIMTTTPRFARIMPDHDAAIIQVAATFGPLVASRGQAVYNATKAGVVGYTRSAAADLLERGIRVNCVLPGGTTHDHAPDRDPRTLRRLGTSRIGAPEDVAAAIHFLASDAAGWITGAALTVDGGESVRPSS